MTSLRDRDSKPLGMPEQSCDWGRCTQDAADWRWWDTGGMWLPVCRAHRQGGDDE